MISEGNERMASAINSKNTTELSISQIMICQGTQDLLSHETKLKKLLTEKNDLMKKQLKIKSANQV